MLKKKYDYVIMNGVFTEKRELSQNEMIKYLVSMLLEVSKIAKKGFAFNLMSKIVDWERDDLFHLSYDKLAKIIIENFGRKFIIRNDYEMYEYTVYIYK